MRDGKISGLALAGGINKFKGVARGLAQHAARLQGNYALGALLFGRPGSNSGVIMPGRSRGRRGCGARRELRRWALRQKQFDFCLNIVDPFRTATAFL